MLDAAHPPWSAGPEWFRTHPVECEPFQVESSPLGIRFEDILVALETHFDYPRKRLVGELSFQLQRLRTLGFVERLRETYWLQKRMAESTFYLGQWTC